MFLLSLISWHWEGRELPNLGGRRGGILWRNLWDGAGIVTVSLFRCFGILRRDCPLSGGWGSAHCTNYRGNEVSLPRLEGLSNSPEVLLSTSILPREGGNVSVEQIHGACLAAMGDIASNSYPILPLTAQVDLPTPINTGHRLLDAEERQAFEKAWKGPHRHVGAQAFPRHQRWQPGHNTSPNYQGYPPFKPSNSLLFRWISGPSLMVIGWLQGGGTCLRQELQPLWSQNL